MVRTWCTETERGDCTGIGEWRERRGNASRTKAVEDNGEPRVDAEETAFPSSSYARANAGTRVYARTAA